MAGKKRASKKDKKRGRKKRPIQLLDRLTSPRFRDLSLASLPIAYGFGFIVWAYYAASKGLGFLPLTSPRYLAVGLVFGLYLAAALAPVPWLLRKMQAPGTSSNRIALHLVATFVTTLVAFFLFIQFPSSLNVFSLGEWEVYVYCFIAPLAALVAVLVFAGQWFIAWFFWKAGALAQLGMARLRRARKVRVGPPSPPLPFLTCFYCVLGLGLFLSCALAFLPSMHPEFGGAMQRHAVLEIPRGELSPTLAAELWDPNQSMSSPILRTKLVTVYYYDEQSFLVRVPPRDDGSGPLYELERSQVRAIQWWD